MTLAAFMPFHFHNDVIILRFAFSAHLFFISKFRKWLLRYCFICCIWYGSVFSVRYFGTTGRNYCAFVQVMRLLKDLCIYSVKEFAICLADVVVFFSPCDWSFDGIQWNLLNSIESYGFCRSQNCVFSSGALNLVA